MKHLFTILFYQPVLNLLVWFYNILPGHDMGIVIIALTILVKLILWPLSQKSLKSQQAINRLQPKIKEIQNKYKNDKEKQGQALMDLYRQEKVNPASSCLPLLIQLPLLWAVFMVFRDGLSNQSLSLVYPFISRPELLKTTFFGIIDLAKPNEILAVATGLVQFFQSKISAHYTMPANTGNGRADNLTAMMSKQMIFMMPIMTVIICWTLPSGLAMYWLFSSLFTIFQQLYWFKKTPKSN